MRSYLVVDDNLELAENLAEILTDQGDEAIAVDSADRALELIGTRPFDVLLTDLRMPKIDGVGLIERARRLDPGLPVLVLTAYAGDKTISAAELYGVIEVLPKPLPMSQLIERVSAARRDGTVLVVEDDVALRENLAEALRGRGLSVVAIGHLDQLESALGCSRPFVALLDLRVPGGGFAESLNRLKLKLPGVPAVVITAFAPELSHEGQLVFRKPFDTAALLEQVDQLYRQRHLPQ